MFESDVPIVLTSIQEEGECLMEQDRGCRPGDQISPTHSDESFFCVPCCGRSCIIVQEQNPSTQEPWSGPTAPSHFHLFLALKSALSGRQTKAVKNFLRSLGTDFYQDGFLKLILR
ncbi:hypothetical protein AVEN_211642-1 [Araneus ventricosus]|uniref:Uncharacterized protein n=1 Tax=Araneus ventricosus TaxID=182803 RepID=A0A4Y2JB31_ARAVE|nr:hypothetical protein AVEN_211642-1 [Araneus ventricosus]